MANIGGCLYIASQIEAGDRDSWYAEWSTFADGLVAQAAVAEQTGHPTSASTLRLRAAEYYRQAFFWHRDDLDGKELTTAYKASVDAFRRALPDLPRPGRVLQGRSCPSFVTDNETDLVSTGQGRCLYDAMTCPKAFRRFTWAAGAEGHCEGLAPTVSWTAAFDWLEATVR